MNALNIQDYTYDLPHDRIAIYPLPNRDESKLLVYRQGQITHETFRSLPDYLPADTLLCFNNTRVIPARLHFRKDTGAGIEIFLLTPEPPHALLTDAMQTHGTVRWKCTIGNVKKWTDGLVLEKTLPTLTLRATLIDRAEGIVEFTWPATASFAEVVTAAGETPLPPYLKRDAEVTDRERYQTVYSHHEGAVAAPTAGLHFTDHVFQALKAKGIQTEFLTLHVSAGTFQPVKVQNAREHTMHNEQIVIRRDNIDTLLRGNRFIVPVGTTSMRTLESLYWYGVKLLKDPEAAFIIEQTDPYTHTAPLPDAPTALHAVKQYMDRHNLDLLTGETSIYIMPGYTFRLCRALITNFHQPASTLILLVAALIGPDWKQVYNEAMTNGYRFLSYGDSSLLIP